MSTLRPILLREGDLSCLAAVLWPHVRAGDVIFLQGDLGAGKTALARALIRVATGDGAREVPSPTFTLVQSYDDVVSGPPVWHFDLYRLACAADVEELGWDEARASAASLVEWPDRLGPFQPADRLEISLHPVESRDDARQVALKGYGAWQARLAGIMFDGFTVEEKSA